MKTRLPIVLAVCTLLICTMGTALAGTSYPASTNWKIAERNYIHGLVSDNEGVRQSAAGYIAEYRLVGAVESLTHVLNTDRVERVRMSAALALIQIGTAEARSAVEYASLHDGSDRVSEFCKSLLSASFAQYSSSN